MLNIARRNRASLMPCYFPFFLLFSRQSLPLCPFCFLPPSAFAFRPSLSPSFSLFHLVRTPTVRSFFRVVFAPFCPPGPAQEQIPRGARKYFTRVADAKLLARHGLNFVSNLEFAAAAGIGRRAEIARWSANLY